MLPVPQRIDSLAAWPEIFLQTMLKCFNLASIFTTEVNCSCVDFFFFLVLQSIPSTVVKAFYVSKIFLKT